MAPGGAGGVIAFAAMFTGSVNHEGREDIRLTTFAAATVVNRADNTISAESGTLLSV